MQSWQGRSWNRLSLHHQIHRSRQLSSAVVLPHARRSISASPDRAPTSSPAKVLAAARLATGAQQPLPQDHHNSLATAVAADPRHTDAAVPDAGAAVAKPRVKRKLLTTASAVPDKAQHIQAVQKQHHAGSDQQLPKPLAQQNKGSVLHVPEPAAGSAERLRSAVGFEIRPAENGSTAAEQQVQGQGQTALSNGNASQKSGPANVKQFLNGMRPSLATWEDVEPDLAKQAALLNRQEFFNFDCHASLVLLVPAVIQLEHTKAHSVHCLEVVKCVHQRCCKDMCLCVHCSCMRRQAACVILWHSEIIKVSAMV